MRNRALALAPLAAALALAAGLAAAHAHGEAPEHEAEGQAQHDAAAPEADGHGPDDHSLERMREMHRGHEHRHDFEAMERMSPEDMRRVMELMTDVGLALPPMDPHRGRELFLEKGCVVCHAINGVGGNVAPSLNAADMPKPMNAFDFAARMWRGAPAMIAMQQAEFGEIIPLDGRELADIIAFAHDEPEQAKLSADQIPERYRDAVMQ